MFSFRSFPLAACVLAAVSLFFATLRVSAEEDEPLEIKAVAGLRFDPPRFVVKPGAHVHLKIENTDDMAHNFVVVSPGGRMEVVNASMTMPITPEQTFIPDNDKILLHTPVLVPGKSAELEFIAPAEGVYPFVCTYPGHGLVMYGAMYVTNGDEHALPKVADDENLPDLIRDQAKNVALHAYPADPPYWYRIFMRDSGPASIAVALPDGQNYCWDAGACRLRYAWRGGFVDPMPHWSGNGDGFAEVKGTIYYRPGAFPLRLGDAKKIPTDVKFKGYRIVDKLPEFHYSIGAADVKELIKPLHHGGLEVTYQISGYKGPLFYVTEPEGGAQAASDAGKFADGVLKVPANKLKQFLVTLIEVPNREPIGYWSMNDVLVDKKPLPVDGVKGRALVFDGKKSQVDTGIKADAFAGEATFSIWAKLATPEVNEQVYIGAQPNKNEGFALGANLAGIPGYGVRVSNATQESKIIAAVPATADDNWHQLAATLGPKGLRFYFDGKPSGAAAYTALPAGAEFFLGSNGETHHVAATLDEARIYARVLTEKEIAALYESERPAAPPPAKTAPPLKTAHAAKPPAAKPAAAPTPAPKPAK